MSKRVKIIIGIVGLIVIAGSATTIVFWPAISGFVASFFNSAKDDSDSDSSGNTPVVINPEIERQAAAAELAGNVEEAAAIYDQEISKTDDKSTKAELYIRKAQVYTNAEDTNAALTAAEQAYAEDDQALGPVTLLALLYEADRQYAKAAEFYRKAAELNPADDPITANKEYYLENAVRLEAM
jgi:tetratricopeptide (TPR) repeat protein